MGPEWLGIVTWILAAIFVVLAFLNLLLRVRQRSDARKIAEKCRDATTKLAGIVEAARDADRERSREKCEKVNREIDAWNEVYAPDCAEGKTAPKLDCEY